MQNQDYTKFSHNKNGKKDKKERVPEPVVEKEPVFEEKKPVVEEAPQVTAAPVIGVVSDDAPNLNVRVAPYATAGIVCAIPAGTKVEIDEEASTDLFYKVCTTVGIEGYCVKSYIVIEG